MNYEIVELKEKNVVGYSARTNNTSPDMGNVISSLWQKLYSPNGCESISDRVNEKALGIYTDYSNDEKGDYTVFAGCEVDGNTYYDGFDAIKIPSGVYAKFIVKGHMINAVAQFWQELWKMNLNRSFICDFEEYQNSDFENAEVHIYIGIK